MHSSCALNEQMETPQTPIIKGLTYLTFELDFCRQMTFIMDLQLTRNQEFCPVYFFSKVNQVEGILLRENERS